jgi:beta-phosphoglucomutase
MQYSHFLFDLDGVLVDTHKLQFKATKEAIKELLNYDISANSEIASLCYSTITTLKKLEHLAERGIITFGQIPIIYAKKKEIADKLFEKEIDLDETKVELFEELRSKGKKIGIVTNGNRSSALKLLGRIGIEGKYDILITNEDVIHPKPHAEPYIRSMLALGAPSIESCIIFEDSEIGLQAARATGCAVYHVTDVLNVNKYNLLS